MKKNFVTARRLALIHPMNSKTFAEVTNLLRKQHKSAKGQNSQQEITTCYKIIIQYIFSV